MEHKRDHCPPVLPAPLHFFPTGSIDTVTGRPLVQFFDHATGTPILARLIDSSSGHPMLMDVYGRLYSCGNPPPPHYLAVPSAPSTSTNAQTIVPQSSLPPPVKPRSSKGILKPARSFEYKVNSREGLKWDEKNILETFHPPDKDYGFISIREPKLSLDLDPADRTEFGQLLQRIEHCAESTAEVVAPLQVPETSQPMLPQPPQLQPWLQPPASEFSSLNTEARAPKQRHKSKEKKKRRHKREEDSSESTL